MEKKILDYVTEKTNDLINAFSCSAEAKAAAQAWLAAVGTENEAEETRKYIAELEADIMPLDNLIAFAGSEQGANYFGADKAKGIVDHANELKAAGEKYCDCPPARPARRSLRRRTRY